MQREEDRDGRIGIVGSGTVGTQLAAFLSEWYDIVVRVNDASKIGSVQRRIGSFRERWRLGSPTHAVMVTTDYSDLGRCAVVIEATNEDLAIKNRTFSEMASALPEDTMLWTTTSSISIDRIVEGIPGQGRCLGFHPFVPINRMKLMEIVRGRLTDDSAVELAKRISEQIGKTPIVVQDRPGFVVNRLLFVQLGEALRMVDSGYAGIQDIDRSVKLGLNHPMGPFELMDLIGLDVCLSIFTNIHDATGSDQFQISPSLLLLVKNNMLGRKAKIGFYEYGLESIEKVNTLLE